MPAYVHFHLLKYIFLQFSTSLVDIFTTLSLYAVVVCLSVCRSLIGRGQSNSGNSDDL